MKKYWIKSNLYALWVSLWNAGIYCIAVGGPTILDPLIKHNTVFIVKMYPLGLFILLPAILVLVATYFAVVGVSRRTKKPLATAMATVFPLIIITFATLPNFAPGIHQQVLFTPLCFGLLIGIGSYVHHYQIDNAFLAEKNISCSTKTERLKMEHDAWFQILLYTSSMYVLAAISLVIYLIDYAKRITTDGKEQEFLVSAFAIQVIMNFVTFVAHPAAEFIRKTAYIRTLITRIKSN